MTEMAWREGKNKIKETICTARAAYLTPDLIYFAAVLLSLWNTNMDVYKIFYSAIILRILNTLSTVWLIVFCLSVVGLYLFPFEE